MIQVHVEENKKTLNIIFCFQIFMFDLHNILVAPGG